MHLLYITFGNNIRNHVQAYFSILSFLNHNKKAQTINVITDKPEIYKAIEKRINIIIANEDLLKNWRGTHDFFWRIKIKGIEHICKLYPNEPVLYLDSDTFFYSDPGYLFELVNEGHAAMHEDEGVLYKFKGKTLSKMARQLKSLELCGLRDLHLYHMWNAGVVLIPNSKNSEDIALALNLCDAMCANKVTDQFVEQFSLAVAMQHVYGLQEAKPVIAHYWSGKEEWNEAIKDFFIENSMKGTSLGDQFDAKLSFDFSKLPVLKISSNSNRRVKKVIDKLLPDKKTAYLK